MTSFFVSQITKNLFKTTTTKFFPAKKWKTNKRHKKQQQQQQQQQQKQRITNKQCVKNKRHSDYISSSAIL